MCFTIYYTSTNNQFSLRIPIRHAYTHEDSHIETTIPFLLLVSVNSIDLNLTSFGIEIIYGNRL